MPRSTWRHHRWRAPIRLTPRTTKLCITNVGRGVIICGSATPLRVAQNNASHSLSATGQLLVCLTKHFSITAMGYARSPKAPPNQNLLGPSLKIICSVTRCQSHCPSKKEFNNKERCKKLTLWTYPCFGPSTNPRNFCGFNPSSSSSISLSTLFPCSSSSNMSILTGKSPWQYVQHKVWRKISDELSLHYEGSNIPVCKSELLWNTGAILVGRQFWGHRADKMLGKPPHGKQKPLVAKDKFGESQVSIESASP